jgi:hypothetical protein
MLHRPDFHREWNKDGDQNHGIRVGKCALIRSHSACSEPACPYHDDDAIYLFHVPNCQFKLLFPLNAFN